MAKSDVLGVIEGFYLAQVLHHLHQRKILDRMKDWVAPAELAREQGYDPDLFEALLEFVYQATDILRKDRARRYALAPRYHRFYHLGFQLEKFIGTYGPVMARLDETLRRPDLGRGLADRAVEAQAYHTIGSPPNPVVLRIARERRLPSLLDLGCGPATLLTELGACDPGFQGWGVDAAAEMCAAARQRVAEAGLADRIRIVQADARQVAEVLSAPERASIAALHCKGLLDELFRSGSSEAVRFLIHLREGFPGRLLFVVDYYGKLTRVPRVKARHRHTMVHDVVQVTTAQGVPPADLTGWLEVYGEAGCSVEHAYEGESSGIQWFVHLVGLTAAQSANRAPGSDRG